MAENIFRRSLTPYIVAAAIVALLLVIVFFWPSDEAKIAQMPQEPTTELEPPVTVEEKFEPAPAPEPVIIEPIEPSISSTPEVVEEEKVVEPEPIDTSDNALIRALLSASSSELFSKLIINDNLIQRFVVSVANLAENEMAPNHRLVNAPMQNFRVYQQAKREWVDSASFKRYTPYVNALEDFDNEALISLFKKYEGALQEKYNEIGDPDTDFRDVLLEAINNLLETPEVKMPIEVYSDSVMFKFADGRLESLSAPQKQLIRTGPDNMRRIKAKLGVIKSLLSQ